jgi:DnaJ like chaperone protein
MTLALSALQGAVFGIVTAHLAGGEPLRFALYGAVGFPLLAVLLRARWPRLASVLGLLLVGLWAATCGAMAYEDPSLQAWEWIPVFAFLGLLFGAGANAFLFGADETVDCEATGDPRRSARRASDAPPGAAGPEAPSHAAAADPWEILCIARDAAPSEIHRAFRARMVEYHPDKVATLGVELRELAEEKSKAISAAYAALAGR